MTITTATVMMTKVMTEMMMVFYCDAQKIVNWLGGQTRPTKICGGMTRDHPFANTWYPCGSLPIGGAHAQIAIDMY
jgi:hypothetical protein